MSLYAKINESNVVETVVVVNDRITNNLSEDEAAQAVSDLFGGGTYVETFHRTAGKNYAGIGHTYNSTRKNFSRVRPALSWTLDETDTWIPPTPKPIGQGPDWVWDEGTLSWVEA